MIYVLRRPPVGSAAARPSNAPSAMLARDILHCHCPLSADICRGQKLGSRICRIRRQNGMPRSKIYRIPRQNHLVMIHDLQDLTAKQKLRIQDLQNPSAKTKAWIQDLQDPTMKQKFRIQDPQDPRSKGLNTEQALKIQDLQDLTTK